MLKKARLLIVIALISIKGFSQSDIVLRDTVFQYIYNNPLDSAIIGITILESDSADQVINELFYVKGESGELYLNSRKFMEYDLFGKMVLELMVYWDQETSAWLNQSKTEKLYDENGFVIQITQIGYANGEISSFSSHMEDFEYDITGKIINHTILLLNQETGEWYNDEKWNYKYNSFGKVLVKQKFEWFENWRLNTELRYSYDQMSNLINIKAYNWNNGLGSLVYSWNSNFIYNLDGLLFLKIDSSNTNKFSEWLPSSKVDYTYAESGDTVFQNLWGWDSKTSDWRLNGKSENVFDSADRLTFSAEYIWNNITGTYEGLFKREELFDDQGDTKFYQSFIWDNAFNSWKIGSNYHIIKNEYGVITDNISNYWNYVDSVYITQFRNFYSRDKYNFLKSESICRGEGLDWNGQYIAESGYYTDSYISQNGRDSITSLSLEVFDIPVLPEITIYGADQVTEMYSSIYLITEVDDSDYKWTIENGSIIISPDRNSVLVEWGTRGLGSVSCIIEHNSGCATDSAKMEVLLESNSISSLAKDSIILFPNPVSDILVVKTLMSNISVCIVDMNGKLLLESKKHEINIEHLPSGSYFTIILDKNGKSLYKQQIIKL